MSFRDELFDLELRIHELIGQRDQLVRDYVMMLHDGLETPEEICESFMDDDLELPDSMVKTGWTPELIQGLITAGLQHRTDTQYPCQASRDCLPRHLADVRVTDEKGGQWFSCTKHLPEHKPVTTVPVSKVGTYGIPKAWKLSPWPP